MALAAQYNGRTSKVSVTMHKGCLAIETWNIFEDRRVLALIPADQIEAFLEDVRTVVNQ